jgi:L-serine dehydratase
MGISVFDLFKIGIGPSSSHTVGPMRAAYAFVHGLIEKQMLVSVHRMSVKLYGSLGATGKGHASDVAILLGLEGEQPDTVDTISIPKRMEQIRSSSTLKLFRQHPIVFHEKDDLQFCGRESLPYHPNALRLSAWDQQNHLVLESVYYSVGGGFVVEEESLRAADVSPLDGFDASTSPLLLPYPFHSAKELLAHTQRHQLPISQVMLENEKIGRDEHQIRQGLLKIWTVMQECVIQGAQREGVLPGMLHVKRRAAALYRALQNPSQHYDPNNPLAVLDWINFYALAVNEENASGGRVVTAPTNGAAGIIPAVLHYYQRFIPNANEEGIIRFLLTAAAIGSLYKENASISGAEVGCQGEVGVACSMAAAGLTEVLGGTPEQVENAAEIGMEHHLGMTCDPIAGLVQIPCIERNAMGAVKAVNAARLALHGDGQHLVSLDKVIRTMKQTGADMKKKYKETSKGGLAVNWVEC